MSVHHMLFVNGGSKKFGNDFRASCAARSIPVTSIRTVHTAFRVYDNAVQVFVKGVPLDVSVYTDAFLRVRGTTPHTASLLVKLLESYGIPVNDPVLREHTDATEKLVQMLLLPRAGVPVPNTWIFSKRSFAANRNAILADVAYPCVLKTSGSQGRAVWKIDDESALIARMNACDGKLMLLQTFVPNTFDIRALCMYGDCIGAIARSSNDGFYNNISHGGSATAITLTDEERTLALRACRAVHVDFGGVDIVRTPHGPMIFEVNCGPQVYGFEGATGICVAEALVQRIVDETRKIG